MHPMPTNTQLQKRDTSQTLAELNTSGAQNRSWYVKGFLIAEALK